MKSKPFRFHPEARLEFRGAIGWYREQSPKAGLDFRIAVSDGVRQLAQAPERWPRHMHGTRRFVLQRFPFSVIYLDEPSVVNIVAVAHSKRKPGYWKRRV